MNITQLLMDEGDAKEVEKKKTGTFRSKRLAEIAGKDGVIEVEFEALSPRKVQQVRGIMTAKDGSPDFSKTVDGSLVAITYGVTNPDLKDAGLRKKFGASTPKDLAEKLFGSEIDALATKIIDLSQTGEDDYTDEELVKN